MITYPVNPASRFAVLQLSTGEIISRNKPWPVTDGTAIPGLDPDYVYLEQITDAQPDYDPRVITLEQTETINAANQELRTSWATIQRPVDEIKINAQNVEAMENQRHYSELERDKLLILGLAVLFRQVANQQLTQREIALKSRILDVGQRIWKNDESLRAKITAIDAGQIPDLDAGWEPKA